jgi:chromosome segregation ATPase
MRLDKKRDIDEAEAQLAAMRGEVELRGQSIKEMGRYLDEERAALGESLTHLQAMVDAVSGMRDADAFAVMPNSPLAEAINFLDSPAAERGKALLKELDDARTEASHLAHDLHYAKQDVEKMREVVEAAREWNTPGDREEKEMELAEAIKRLEQQRG